jgi:general secretion pathway protein E
VDRALQTLIHDGASEQAMTDAVRAKSPAILDDGRARVLSGSTSLEEVLRVTSTMG